MYTSQCRPTHWESDCWLTHSLWLGGDASFLWHKYLHCSHMLDCNSADESWHETQKCLVGGGKAYKIRLSIDQSLILYVTFRCERDVQCSLFPDEP